LEEKTVSLARDEIAEQPDVLARLLDAQAPAIAAAAAEIRRRRPRFAVIAARGSSDNAARYAQHLLGRLCGLPVALATPSLHTLYDAPPRYVDALVIGISQSGASPDVVSVIEAAAAEGCVTVAITNEPGSPMGAAAGHVVDLGTGPERSVAATKTYTASLGAVAALAVAIAQDHDRERELAGMPDAIARQLRLTDGPEAAASAAAGWERLAVIGRGANYGTAFEAALKIKELTGVAAEPYSPADFLHGPIAVVGEGFPVLAIAAAGPALEGIHEVLASVRERDGDVWAIAEASPPIDRAGHIPLVPTPEWLSALVAVIPAQLLAVAAAERRGLDVDRPFGLQKVTRTR
jgi:glucosamine--fructose-6-phosphate aminotransferase (isomerizing)